VLRLRGEALSRLGRIDEAEQELHQLEAMDGASPYTFLLRARLETERRRFPAALAWMERYLNESPDESQGYYRRGIIYFQQGDFTRALEDFQEYTRLAPNAVEGYEQQFLCYMERQQLAEAIRVGKLAVDLQPHNFRLQYNLAFSHLLAGEVEQAIQGFITALQADTSDAELLLRIYIALTEYAARATRPEPMVPLAPLTFVTTTVWPSDDLSESATMRATMSGGGSVPRGEPRPGAVRGRGLGTRRSGWCAPGWFAWPRTGRSSGTPRT